MLRFRHFYKSLGLSRKWFVENTGLSYACIRDLDGRAIKPPKTTTLQLIYKVTKEKFGVGALPGDYLDGEMWEQCRSKEYSDKIEVWKADMKFTGLDPDARITRDDRMSVEEESEVDDVQPEDLITGTLTEPTNETPESTPEAGQ